MKKLLVIALLTGTMLVGCKSESTADVQAILPEPTTIAVEEEILDVSEFVDMKLPIDSRSFYMNLGLGESSMDIAGRGSIVYMGTSVADMSMSFWYDTETSQIKFESKAGDEAEYFEGPISSESVEAQTDTGIDVLKLVSAESVEKVGDLIEITGDISMGDQEYSGAQVKLYDDRTLHSVTAENEDGTIEVYSLLKDDSKFPAIPDVEYTSITEEEADEKVFASVMLLMAGALSTIDDSDIISDLENNAFAQYDNSKCVGIDVISAIRSYASEDMTIIVEEADGSVYGFGAEIDGLLYDVVYTEDSSFIEHAGRYTSTLIEGDTGVVGIHFKSTSEEELVEEFGTR